MKGIVLAGGSGTRLYPLTISTSKQILPIYDKPMIYYPISVLMLAGIRDILIISTPNDLPNFKNILGNGEQFGLRFSYSEQKNPDGIAQAFIIGESFIGGDCVALILGDNIYYGNGMTNILEEACLNSKLNKATIFGYYVNNPESYGVIGFDDNNKILNIEEKPKNPKSNYCVTGLYFYDNRVVEFSKNIKKSNRGELEITDINNMYLELDDLNLILLGRGFTWFDAGTADRIADASTFVRNVVNGHGVQVAVLEEIAYNNKWIDKPELLNAAKLYGNSAYGKHIDNIIHNRIMY